MPTLGKTYVFSKDGINQIRRYSLGSEDILPEGVLVDDRPDCVPIPVLAGPTLIGEVLAVVSAVPVQLEPHYQRPQTARSPT